MDKKTKLFSAAVWVLPILGVAAGVFYALFMEFGFDELGLLQYNDTYQYFLIGALVLAIIPAVLCAVDARRTPKDNGSLFLTKRPSGFPMTLYVIAASAAGIAGFLRFIVSARALDVMGIILGALGIGSCIALFVFVKYLKTGEAKKAYGPMFLLPAVWMAIRLIVVFRDVSINPTISSYFYDVLAGILALLAYYTCISMLYQRKNYTLWMIISCLSVAMSLCAGLGHVLYDINTGAFAELFLHPIANGETIAFYFLLLFGLCFPVAAIIHWAETRARH